MSVYQLHGPGSEVCVTVRRAEIFRNVEPIRIDIDSATAEISDTPSTIHALSSKVPRLMVRLGGADAHFGSIQRKSRCGTIFRRYSPSSIVRKKRTVCVDGM